MTTAIAPPPSTTAVAPPPSKVSDMTKEQRNALLVDLIKAHFAEAGMPWYLSVRDGETLLGIFHPEFHRPAKPTIPDFAPEEIAEIKRRAAEVRSGQAKSITSEEFQRLLATEDGRKRLV